MGQKTLPGRPPGWRGTLNRLVVSIRTKIFLPYLLVALAVGGIGYFVVVGLVTGSMRERFNNQLFDAGRIVSENMVMYEEDRLAVLRAVAGTQGVPESLATANREALANLLPQILANSKSDAVELLDVKGVEVYGWQRPPGQGEGDAEERSGADFSELEDVRLVLDGHVDEFGEKRVLLNETPYGLMIFTVGPVYREGEQVGAAMVGTYIREMVVELTEVAVAKVTLYDRNGVVIDTTVAGGQEDFTQALQETPEQYNVVTTLLQESPNRYQAVVAETEDQVFLRQLDILGQSYVLAFGDWRLRDQSFGFFSVALPSNFIVAKLAASRNLLSLIFSLATVAVITTGFVIAQRTIHPLNRLVDISIAVAAGDLEQRTGIQRTDEIGSLAYSFDAMIERLEERNRALAEQAGKLEAILTSITDGVVVLDAEGKAITSNPAAQRVLADVSSEFPSGPPRELLPVLFTGNEGDPEMDPSLTLAMLQQPRRYRVGNRVLSAWASPVGTPEGEELGTIVVLRDVPAQVDLLTISPFVTVGPTSDRVFFGREQELQEVTGRIDHFSYAIIGGRRIGKSSLLGRLHRTHLPVAGFRTLYHDCSTTPTYATFLAAIIHDWRLEPPPDAPGTFGDLLDAPPTDRPVVLLLDEADKLVPADRAEGWRLFNKLRALANAGQLSVVLSGERTLRGALRDSASPLFNFANEMLLGPLNFQAVKDLVTQPMQQLEIELVDREAMVCRIYDFTSGHPNVVQRLCSHLIEQLNKRETRRITLEDVNAVIEDPQFQEVDFLQTYWEAATPLEKIITLVLSQEAKTYRLKEVHHLLAEQAHIQPSATAAKDALDRLVDLRSILKRSQAGYAFAVEAFPSVLANTTTVEDLLEVLVEQYQQTEAPA